MDNWKKRRWIEKKWKKTVEQVGHEPSRPVDNATINDTKINYHVYNFTGGKLDGAATVA